MAPAGTFRTGPTRSGFGSDALRLTQARTIAAGDLLALTAWRVCQSPAIDLAWPTERTDRSPLGVSSIAGGEASRSAR